MKDRIWVSESALVQHCGSDKLTTLNSDRVPRHHKKISCSAREAILHALNSAGLGNSGSVHFWQEWITAQHSTPVTKSTLFWKFIKKSLRYWQSPWQLLNRLQINMLILLSCLPLWILHWLVELLRAKVMSCLHLPITLVTVSDFLLFWH